MSSQKCATQYAALSEQVLSQKSKMSGGYLVACLFLLLVNLIAVIAICVLTEGQFHSAGIISCLLAIVAFGMSLPRLEQFALALSPISMHEDENLCAEALKLVERSASARTWRDTAIAQGRTLRGFDLAEMRRLAAHEEASKKNEQRARDCKELHGLVA